MRNLLLLLLTFILFGGTTYIYAQANKPDSASQKSEEKALSDQIPEEFKRIGKGLPPSKRRILRMWIYKIQFETPYPRFRAAREIYWYKDKEAIPYLIVALRDNYWGVRQAAALALANIGVKKYDYIIYKQPEQQKYKELRDDLTKKEDPLHQKGALLLQAEQIREFKMSVDVIKELQTAYYREVQFFKDEHTKMMIRKALEIMGAVPKIEIKYDGSENSKSSQNNTQGDSLNKDPKSDQKQG